MSKRRGFLSNCVFLTQVVISGFIFSFFSTPVNAKSETILYSMKPAAFKQYNIPYSPHHGIGYLNSDSYLQEKELTYRYPAPLPIDNVFKIEASDAIGGMKYSQPDVAYSLFNFNAGIKVPSTTLKQRLLKTAQNRNPENFQEQSVTTHEFSNKDEIKPLRDIRYLDSVDEEIKTDAGDSNYKIKNKNILQTDSYDMGTTDVYTQSKGNFTDASDNLVSVSSDAVLSYVPSEFNYSSENSSVKPSTDIVNDVHSLNFSNFNSSILYPSAKTDHTTQNSVSLKKHVYIELMNQTNLTDSSVLSTSIFPSTSNEENVTNSLPSTDSEKKLSSGTVAGIVIVVLVSVTLLSSAVIYLLYRKFNGRCTSVVESKFNTDNCGYLDDSLRSSIYLNNHIELPKESSEEMTSLDNDSFLNSLETMTIQNYWADNSKNTKV